MKIVRTFVINDRRQGTAPIYLTMTTEVGPSWHAQNDAEVKLKAVAAKIQAALDSEDR